ncbi:MAG: PQQ-dependent sugar dehydrogenase [Bacteroidota bacterium]
MRYLYLAACLLLVAPASAQEFENAFPSLTFDGPIVDIQAPDDGSNRLFVAEQVGTVRVFQNDEASTQTALFLDITDRVSTARSNEKGVSGLAFDPAYAQNGYFYISYTAEDPLRLVVERYTVSATNPNRADPSSAVAMVRVPLPDDEHHAGQLQFGPDGYLYLSLGDGTFNFFNGDPFENGQNPATLLGSLLRLDVRGAGQPLDCAAGTGLATLPAGNPLADGPGGVCDEIYAFGFRNPWRFSFAPDGRLWLGDVGQSDREEINVVEPGDNYGWNTYEGTRCFDAPCDPAGLTFPIYEHPHNFFSGQGAFSVIGGYVYRGNTCAPLLGKYVYGDFVTTNTWTLGFDGVDATNEVLVRSSGFAVTTFGESEQGELYLGDSDGDTLQRLDCAQPVTVAVAPVGPATVPASGGALTLDVTLTNTTASAQTTQAWATADLSDGSERVVAAPVAVRLPAGASVTRRVTLGVPGLAPAGVSTLVVKTGSFPDAASSADLVAVTKLGGSIGDHAASGDAWQAEGFRFDGAEAGDPAAQAVAEPAALSAFPTPFAGRTTVRYVLGEAGPVRVSVFDVLGREVAVLADGQAEAGTHEAVFEAAGLPSGVYLVQLDAGRRVAVQTVTLAR